MTYDDLYVLIPSHSLEDFPTELGNEEAAGLLNAFAVLWHPVLLAQAETTPGWHRSDEPPETLENRLVIVPSNAEEWLPGGWAGHAQLQGATVITNTHDRAEMVRRALEPLDEPAEVDPDLVADFLALGTCWLMVELLTIHMHHFSNLDEVELQREAVAAAKAAVTGDADGARAHLKSCFETLLEARERFYPVECYLLDLCLLIPRLADEHLEQTLTGDVPVNLLLSGIDLQTIAGRKSKIADLIREGWDGGRIDVAGGELHERPTPLLPMESVLWEFHAGHRTYGELLGRTPKTWGRRRFGFSTQLPQILNRFGFIAGLHVALDDGLYPDAEQSKIRWEGCDGTVVDAITRIPLAGDSAGSYLRFPQRMGESMEEDHVATVIFARWPEVKAPWFEDFRRIHHYAPVLGRFVTFEDFFDNTDDPGRMSSYDAGEYLSPYLIQSVALQEADPLSRYSRHLKRRHQFDAACFCRALSRLLRSEAVAESDVAEIESRLESTGPDGHHGDDEDVPTTPPDEPATIEQMDAFTTESVRRLSEIVMAGAGDRPGYLLINPLAHSRCVPVDLPELASAPDVSGAVKGAQFDDARRTVTVELPPCGFAWIGGSKADGPRPVGPRPDASPPLAEENLLRNEFFEVWINEETGGIGRVKGYGRSPNRLSQQIARRFPEERIWITGEGEDAERLRSFYSEMRCASSVIRSAGPLIGEIETAGDIVDQPTGKRLARFRQIFRLYRGLPYVDVEIELSDVAELPEGDPWTNYFACRWAHNDMTASLTRSVQQGAQGFQGQRFESLHYLEIATPEQRTTICLAGSAFHRKTGPRMIDTLLLVAGETNRRFRFRIALDVDYPLHPAMDLVSPPLAVPTVDGPPAMGPAGWFFHVSAKNVQILRIMDVLPEPVDEGFAGDVDHDHAGRVSDASDEKRAIHTDDLESRPPAREGFAVRLMETEGRGRRVRLRCFRSPKSARQRDFRGRTLNDLPVEDDAVLVEMTAHEIADVEVLF